MEKAFVDYLATLNIPVSQKYFRKRVASHPDYPSLLSISDTLKNLGIPHGVAKMDRESLKNLELPYVLHLEKDAGRFIVIKEESNLKQEEDISEDWSGVVLKAERVDEVKDAENQRYLSEEKAGRFAFGLLSVSVLIMAVVGLLHGFSWAANLFLATSIIGVVLGCLLIAKDLGITFDVVELFCNTGQKTNCDRVLRSDEATLFGRFSLSDSVLSYFTAQLIALGLLIPVAGDAALLWWALATAGVFALPIVAYSLWLQGAKFKTWCRLCLLLAGLLVVQAGLFGWMGSAGVFGLTDGNFFTTGLVAGLFLTIGSLVFILKSRLKEGAEAEQAGVEAKRVKYDPAVFTFLLLQQTQADCTPFEQELLIGKPETPVKISIAASLGCGHCKEGFENAVQLVKRWPEHVSLSVRFSMPNIENREESNHHLGEVLLGGWLNNIYGKENHLGKTAGLIIDWYSSMHFEKFRNEYSYEPTNGQDKITRNLIQLHTEWFEKEGINKTPIFFVNGYSLPVHYRIQEITRLFPELIDRIPTVKNISENDQTVLTR